MANLTTSTSGNWTLINNSDLCTLDTCDMSLSQLGYRPSFGGNLFYTIVFGLFLVAQIYLGVKFRMWGFMVAMVGGLALEILGYASRVALYNNPFDDNDFLIYIVCLTIAPALLAAGIYLCLGRIVVVYGESTSRFRPGTYTMVFCTCDFFSLLLQAVGGAIASTASNNQNQSLTQTGINLMLAGLSVQVASIALFACLCAEFAYRLYRAPESWSLKHQALYSSRLFTLFLCSLTLATTTIFIRSIFRVAELSGGFNGPLATNQISFMILEGAMIVTACSCLTFLHPGIAFQGVWGEANFSFRRRSAPRGTVGNAEKSGATSAGDTGGVSTPVGSV